MSWFNYRDILKDSNQTCANCGFCEDVSAGSLYCKLQNALTDRSPIYTNHTQVCDAWQPKEIGTLKGLIEENIRLKRGIK